MVLQFKVGLGEIKQTNATMLRDLLLETNGKPWSYLVELLKNESGDLEFCQHTMLLINKVLAAVPDQETFYDITDYLEDQGMHEIAEKYLKQPNADPTLMEQFAVYEVCSEADRTTLLTHLNP